MFLLLLLLLELNSMINLDAAFNLSKHCFQFNLVFLFFAMDRFFFGGDFRIVDHVYVCAHTGTKHYPLANPFKISFKTIEPIVDTKQMVRLSNITGNTILRPNILLRNTKTQPYPAPCTPHNVVHRHHS